MDTTYAQQYILIVVLTITALVIAITPIVLSRLLAPRKPSQSKHSAYECGLESTGEPWVQFRVQYYLYALLFVIFDVEVVFIYPWALVWRGLGPVILAEMALFLVILAVGLVYAWKKGVLEWE